MRKSVQSVVVISSCLLSTVLLGCATVKEMGKGFAGISTQVLDQKRKDALKKSFALSYDDCYAKVKKILILDASAKETLNKSVDAPYIYSDDLKRKMVAIYLSQADTTPVGIFFTEQAGGNTLVEISSPSIYAKEEIAKLIFGGLADNREILKEKSADDKEKISN